MTSPVAEFIQRNEDKLDRLPTDLARDWIVGLVENAELQTTGRLADATDAEELEVIPEKFCCLGYGCHLYDPSKWLPRLVRHTSKPQTIWSYAQSGNAQRLTEEVRDALGLRSIVGAARQGRPDLSSLATLNDKKIPWPKIAQHALDNLEAYFNVDAEAEP